MTLKLWPPPHGVMKQNKGALYPCYVCGRGVYADEAVKKDGHHYHLSCYDPPQEQTAKMKVFGPNV